MGENSGNEGDNVCFQCLEPAFSNKYEKVKSPSQSHKNLNTTCGRNVVIETIGAKMLRCRWKQNLD